MRGAYVCGYPSAVANVSVNRGILIGVGTVAAVSLLALAFVLGRESGTGSVPAPLTRVERAASRPQAEPLPPPTPVAAAITERAETQPTAWPAPAAPGPGVAVPAAAVQPAVPIDSGRNNLSADPARAAVAAYFDAVDRIQPGAMSGDAEAVANKMGAALANGDMSGLDKLIRQTEAAREKFAAVVPPPTCANFHRESLASVDDALAIVRSLKTAMESPDPAAQLANVAARANALRTRADVLQKEEQDLRQRYGLKR
jgi:hypothetical protein